MKPLELLLACDRLQYNTTEHLYRHLTQTILARKRVMLGYIIVIVQGEYYWFYIVVELRGQVYLMLSHRRPQFCSLAESKRKFVISRPNFSYG